MYYNGQTLISKDKKRLVRIKPINSSTFFWHNNKKVLFIAEDGKEFTDDINNYTYIVDEFDRSYNPPIKKGEYVGTEVKKYLVSKKKLMEMREKRLKEWENEILERMKSKKNPMHKRFDKPGKTVFCPFSDGKSCLMFQEFFLKNRNATSLYEEWGTLFNQNFKDGFVSGPMAFKHTDGQVWIYDYYVDKLIVIKFNNSLLTIK